VTARNPLRDALNDYLTLRRSLGYKLACPEKLLGQLIAYLDDVGLDTVTAEARRGYPAALRTRLPIGSLDLC
jgi:hypothetical protein